MFLFALAIFLSAFLLFQVQPLMAKYILPWFGGGPGVWSACLLFFQCALLGGYAYAHWLGTRASWRRQAAIHLCVWAVAVCLLPITPGDYWKPQDGSIPVLRIGVLLIATVGLPYFALSSTSPLLQRWFSAGHPGVSPYRLFALSNAGSLLALLSYPFYFETHFTRRAQGTLWSIGFAVCALLLAGCGVLLRRKLKTLGVPANANGGTAEPPPAARRPGRVQQMLWFLFPACASVLLMAGTNKLCQDIAVIPFLWILPLAVYLLSFILCFDHSRWYARVPFGLALLASLWGLAWVMRRGTDISLTKHILFYTIGLFVCCMVCHGEVYRLRPDPRLLTRFYLVISAGGALGGVLVALVAPFVFNGFYELHIGLFSCGLLFLLTCARDWSSSGQATGSTGEWKWLGCLLPVLAMLALDRLLAELNRGYQHVPRSWFVGLRCFTWAVFAALAASWVLRGSYRSFRHWRLMTCLWLLLGLAGLGTVLWRDISRRDSDLVCRTRNFYGLLSVYEHRKADPLEHHFLLQHGGTTHGLQFVESDQVRWPTTYYGRESGIGLAIESLPEAPRRLGLVGLGTGTLATYGRAGDLIHIYEINPEILRISSSNFSFVSDSEAHVEVILGDARLSLERQAPQEFDLLALDAFSSDAIPVHLLTCEAFALYERHVKPGGIIAVHISNHYLDLEPVVAGLARQFGYKQAVIDYEELEGDWWLYASTWILLSKDEAKLKVEAIANAARKDECSAKPILWTDDFVSLYPILKSKAR